jgi:Zn-dependent metalloprotease
LAPPVPITEAQPRRTILTAKNRFGVRGTEVRSEGDPPTGDAEVDEAYEGLGDTFNFYRDVLARNSIDDLGMPMVGTVHVGRIYDNAMWTGNQMVFGNGDRLAFNRFTITVDILGHELTHGVTGHEAGLVYWAQAGALDESISDIFGSLVKQYKRKQRARDADWLMGADAMASAKLLLPAVNGDGLRSLKAPGDAYNDPLLGGKDPQPNHMRAYVRTFKDNGGVHINSGIPNRAFYLFATALDGYAFEDPAAVWYQTLLSPLLRPTADFETFASITLLAASRMFGGRSDQAVALKDAWNDVGVKVP